MTTESDRELLELAAKANGLPWKWVKCPAYKTEVPGILRRDEVHEVDYYPGWNPLENDGDALRLAVKLEFDVTRYSRYEVAVTGRSPTHGTPGIYLTERQSLDSDPYAATRRAIVRAAAEIARATHKEGA